MYISYLLYSKHSEVFSGLSSSLQQPESTAIPEVTSQMKYSLLICYLRVCFQRGLSKESSASACLCSTLSLSSHPSPRPIIQDVQNNFTYNFPNVTLCLMLSYPAQVVFTLIWTSQCQLYVLHPITSAYPSNHISVFNFALITATSFHRYRTLIS